jgi:hypothetical protein
VSRSRWILLLLVVAAVGLAIALFVRSQHRAVSVRLEVTSRPASTPASHTTAAVALDAGTPAQRRRAEARAKRDAQRELILRALATPATSPTSAVTTPPRVYPPGDMKDRIGGRDALVKHLNHELMPLADECIAQAQELDPQLSGMLAFDLRTVADEELGAVIDEAKLATLNTIVDPALIECVRESALSLSLAPPLTSGREEFMISLRVEPLPDAGR